MFGGKQPNGFNRVAVGVNHGGGRRGPQKGEIHQQIHHGDGGETAEEREGHIALGVLHVTGHGRGIFPTGIGKEHQQNCIGKGRREPTRRRAQGFGGWFGRDVTQKHQDTEGKKNGHFGHRADRDHRAAKANGADMHRGGNPDERYGQTGLAQNALHRAGQKGVQVRGASRRHRRNRGHTDQNQIGCTLNERGLATKRGSPIQIMSPGVWIGGRQFAVHASAKSSNDSRHNPSHHKSIRGHKVGTNHTTQGEDPGADHRCDHHAGRAEGADVAFVFLGGWRIGRRHGWE